jgi:hypothetical protein
MKRPHEAGLKPPMDWLVQHGSLCAAVVLLVALLARFARDDDPLAYWWTEIDHGCKPSIGLLLTERGGVFIGCSFFVLEPDDDTGAPRRAMQFPAVIREKTPQRYEIDVDLAPAGDRERFSLHIHGRAGDDNCPAEIASGSALNRATQRVIFRSVDQDVVRRHSGGMSLP